MATAKGSDFLRSAAGSQAVTRNLERLLLPHRAGLGRDRPLSSCQDYRPRGGLVPGVWPREVSEMGQWTGVRVRRAERSASGLCCSECVTL